jgi:outer membrane protease
VPKGQRHIGAKDRVCMRYAGLTDEPQRRKREHNNPRDFRVMQQFTSEQAARQWERRMLGQGYIQDTPGKGWKFGYTFST